MRQRSISCLRLRPKTLPSKSKNLQWHSPRYRSQLRGGRVVLDSKAIKDESLQDLLGRRRAPCCWTAMEEDLVAPRDHSIPEICLSCLVNGTHPTMTKTVQLWTAHVR